MKFIHKMKFINNVKIITYEFKKKLVYQFIKYKKMAKTMYDKTYFARENFNCCKWS